MKISVKGELKRRLELSFDRLSQDEYRLHIDRQRDSGGWPGDWEGRAILAQASLAKVLGKLPFEFEKSLDKVIADIAEQGYYGNKVQNGICDEQQLSGNSWLLSALCEYFDYSGDKRIPPMIEKMTDGLLLPCKDKYKRYPSDPNDRVVDSGGVEIGTTVTMIDDWITSSDTGCAFIMIDGATRALQTLINIKSAPARISNLRALIHEMAEEYFKLDFIKSCVQTHSTLSGLRGIIRLASMENDTGLIKKCEEIANLYFHEAITENFANYNWFNRPEWTEPCAYLDSIAVCLTLFSQTKNPEYIDKMNYVYANAVGFGQRQNGGFGLDYCVGNTKYTRDEYLTVHFYDAAWCCTMRGGDVLSMIAEGLVSETENGYYVTMYNDCENEALKIEGSAVTVKIDMNKPLYLLIPGWANNGTAEFKEVCRPKAGDVIEMEFDGGKREERNASCVNSLGGKTRYFAGYNMLAKNLAEGTGGAALTPLDGLSMTEDDILGCKMQVFF